MYGFLLQTRYTMVYPKIATWKSNDERLQLGMAPAYDHPVSQILLAHEHQPSRTWYTWYHSWHIRTVYTSWPGNKGNNLLHRVAVCLATFRNQPSVEYSTLLPKKEQITLQ